ncbi:MAG: hypothetical protein RJA22_3058 [Verrucomicrobiota bacterium]|jgi:hypothetical protein
MSIFLLLPRTVLPRGGRSWTAALVLLFCCLAGPAAPAASLPRIAINEVHYHPVELPAFTNGLPVLDLSRDVHEFVELHNHGTTNVSLAGWQLSGDIDFFFATNAVLHAGQYLVVARNPARLASIVQYTNLAGTNLAGPYAGNLGNNNGTVRLRDALGNTVDAVSYSAGFPWAMSADALGADDEWTGLRSTNFQYRGRSLERVSVTWAANDPANWLASPTNGPSPGRSNAVVRAIPRPVVIAVAAYATTNGDPIIRSNQTVRLECQFSSTNQLSSVSVQYFIDDINLTTETLTISSMTPYGPPAEGRYAVTLPARPDRSVVRYRIRANRGAAIEVVSPRADDPFPYHAYFVTPERVSTNRIFDCFISAVSLNTLATNLNPNTPPPVTTAVYRRIRQPDPPGNPSLTWNATEPAILVVDGRVYDARARYHGSQYRRNSVNNSWKWQFPRYQRFEGRSGFFISDNTEETVACSLLYRLAGIPQAYTTWMDFYLNNSPVTRRMDHHEMNDELVETYFKELQRADPDRPDEGSGEIYKSQGNFLFTDPIGPFGYGGYRLLPARPPYWTELQRYEHTFGLQMNGWKGHMPFMDMLRGMWGARGDTHGAPNPNIPNLRAWLGANFDLDATLTSMAIRVWTAGWDNFNHNHFMWRRENGRWVILQWDFDFELDAADATASIYASEYGVPLVSPQFGQLVNGVPWVDANWVNDSMFKAYREEYKRKLFVLNNTLLNPTNISALGLGAYRAFADARFASINSQLGYGAFRRPNRPVNVAPLAGQVVLPPASLAASAYSHGASPAPAHASTTWLLRAADGTYDAPILRRTSTTNRTSLPLPFERLTFGRTYFWKCLYTDTNGHPSLESAETSFVYGGTVTTPGSVVINEVLADNRGVATNGSTSPDYLELLNTTGSTQSLNGFSLSDDVLVPGKYVFPPGAAIPPFGRLVVWCDDATNAPGLHTGFALDNDGQTLALFSVGGGSYQLADLVTFGLQAPDYALARDPDGFGGWELTLPTPGQDNTLSTTATGPAGVLRINEWMASDAGGPDWIELYNPSDLPVALGGLYWNDGVVWDTNSPVPARSYIGAGRHLQFIADGDLEGGARHVGFRLNGSGDSVGLFDGAGQPLDVVTFGPQASGVSQGRLPDGTAAIVSFPDSPSPADPNYLPLAGLVINEVLAHSDPPLEDAVEIRNLTATNVAVGGWWLSDDKNAPRKYALPAGAVVPAQGFLVLYENQFNPAPGQPGSFGFSSARGDAVHLFEADAGGAPTGQRASASFDASASGVSLGRFLTSQGPAFGALAARTFGADQPPTVEAFRLGTGAPNSLPAVGPVVISEVLYHPPDDPGGVENARDEFIELRNLGTQPVPLSAHGRSWRLRDAVDYDFPAGTVLNPGEVLLVVGFDPVADTNALQGFLETYGTLAARLFGPWIGGLNNAGDSVELVRPDEPVSEPGPDYGYVPFVLVDKVRYQDRYPWPEAADGDGFSLMRAVPGDYGNDPTNWFGWFPTPGVANFVNLPPQVTLISPASGASVLAPTNVVLAVTAQDPDGFISRIDYFDGTNRIGSGLTPPFQLVWTNPAPGLHTLTARARDNGNATAVSSPVVLQVATLPPVVTLTSPAAGATYLSGAAVPLSATATDPDTPVARVEFLVDGLPVAADTVAPYSTNWVAQPGYRLLSAVATDSSGVSATSAVRRIFVQTATNLSVLVASNATWRYLDNGSNPGTTWTNLTYPDATWGSGRAELGFGDTAEGRPEATLLRGPGFLAYYFRHAFVLAGTNGITSATLNVIRDDGAIAYLNGVEVFRDNMPAGVVTYLTPASLAIAGTNEATFIPTNVSPALLVPGTNILTFEVHQNATNSSDISFAAELRINPLTLLGPAITSHPASRTNLPGDSVTFTVGATGTAPLRYQWFFNGAPLAGQTNASLVLPAIEAAQAGAYTVLVTNSLAGVVSDPATLAIQEGDTDGDGLPDSWELFYGFDPLDPADGTADPDLDRFNNRSEYLAGTHPLDPASYLRLASISRGRTALLSFTALSNTAYTVQFAEAISGPWQSLALIPPGAVTRTESLADPAVSATRFYRVATPAAPAVPARLQSLAVAPATVLGFHAVSNRAYRVEHAPAPGAAWTLLQDFTPRSASRDVQLADPTNLPRRVYRVVIPAAP